MPSATNRPDLATVRCRRRITSEVSDKMPPSPLLSARITNARYLIEMTMTSDQNASEATPYTFTLSTTIVWCSSVNDSRSAYSGLVPMSPYTTPSAPRASAMVPALLCPWWS